MTRHLTVLYDATCPLCQRFREWLGNQPLLVPTEFVAAGSPRALERYPQLDHAQTLKDITVVGDDGSIWTKEHAWVMCLWVTASHRGLAERLAQPAWLPLARAAAHAAAGLRKRSRTNQEGDYIEPCVRAGSPSNQG